MSDVGMNRGILATANGMLAAQRSMDVVANNLANASTTGFKRDVLAFRNSLMQEVQSGEDGLLVVGANGEGPDTPIQRTSFGQGALRTTGGPLDVALTTGEGMFALQTPQGVQYTRNGSFHLNTEGVLVSAEGFPVLDEARNPIQVPEGAVEIMANGEIAAGGLPAGKIGVFTGVFSKQGTNLYAGAGVDPMPEPSMAWKTLEDSNVNPIEAMIEMITLGRTFEMAQKNIQTQDEMAQKLIQSLENR